MFTHNSLVDACTHSGLDTTKTGSNIHATGHPLRCLPNVFDLRSIGFPAEELEQVEKIGILAHNLVSQASSHSFYDFSTEEGKERIRRDEAIKTMVPIAEKSVQFWLNKGLEKSEDRNSNLVVHNGRVYEVDPNYDTTMKNMNESMEECRRDFIVKNARSEESGSDTILCS